MARPAVADPTPFVSTVPPLCWPSSRNAVAFRLPRADVAEFCLYDGSLMVDRDARQCCSSSRKPPTSRSSPGIPYSDASAAAAAGAPSGEMPDVTAQAAEREATDRAAFMQVEPKPRLSAVGGAACSSLSMAEPIAEPRDDEGPMEPPSTLMRLAWLASTEELRARPLGLLVLSLSEPSLLSSQSLTSCSSRKRKLKAGTCQLFLPPWDYGNGVGGPRPGPHCSLNSTSPHRTTYLLPWEVLNENHSS